MDFFHDSRIDSESGFECAEATGYFDQGGIELYKRILHCAILAVTVHTTGGYRQSGSGLFQALLRFTKAKPRPTVRQSRVLDVCLDCNQLRLETASLINRAFTG